MFQRHFDPLVAVVALMCMHVSVEADERYDLDRRPQPWQRRAAPVLSARTTTLSWRGVVCYSPHVIHHDGKYRMWYLGTSTASRSNDIAMGYAESEDGLAWVEHPDNPIFTGDDVPWGITVQTPFVMWDADDLQYRMWFVSGDGVERDAENQITLNDQRLGYATSRDGVDWEVHPEPIYPSGRSPSVLKEAPNRYRMWMGSRPDPEDRVSGELYSNIYEFDSEDGLNWNRSELPVIRPSGPARSTVYPFVVNADSRYYMWYGCHLEGGRFEIFSATSDDGSQWRVHHDEPAFPAAADRERFDGRYTSTPCIVIRPDRYLLFYSARDWNNEYVDAEGRTRRDGAGVYADIGMAELPK